MVRSEWTKLRALRSTWWCALSAVVLIVGLGAAIAGSGAPYTISAGNSAAAGVSASLLGLLFAQLVIGVLGVLAFSGEYGTGMIRATLAVVPSRLPVLWAKLIVLAGLVLPVTLLCAVADFFTAAALESSRGGSAISLTDRERGGRILHVLRVASRRRAHGRAPASCWTPGRSTRGCRPALTCWRWPDGGIGRRRVDEVIELAGLGEVAGARAGGFSLGMGQRLGVAARCWGGRRRWCWTSRSTAWTRTGCAGSGCCSVAGRRGAHVFVSSHLMSEMAQTATRLVVLGRGRLISQTSVQEFTGHAPPGCCPDAGTCGSGSCWPLPVSP